MENKFPFVPPVPPTRQVLEQPAQQLPPQQPINQKEQQQEQKSITERVVETIAPVIADAKEEFIPTVYASGSKNEEEERLKLGRYQLKSALGSVASEALGPFAPAGLGLSQTCEEVQKQMPEGDFKEALKFVGDVGESAGTGGIIGQALGGAGGAIAGEEGQEIGKVASELVGAGGNC